MRVAMVSEHASPLAALGSVDAGGQNVHVAALATAMGRAGHEVTVYTRRDSPDLDAVVPLAPSVEVVHVDAGPPAPVPKDELWPHMPAFACALAEHWRADAPQIVHSHFWMSGWAAREGAGDLAVPVVHTYHALGLTKRRHQGGSDTSPGAREPVERMLAQRCERIVATSHEEMFELVRLGSQPQRLSLVPCGVDHQHFDETCDRSAWDHVWSRSRRVLVVSRLVERKGIDDVVTALAAVPDAELLIAGGPERCRLDGEPEAQRLLAVARRHGVEDRVRLLGRVDRADLPTLYRSADVVVCTPWYEPFGLVALEAMACGVPVVASAVGGLVDTVLDGVTGILVPPHRPDVIAHAVTGLLDAPAQRARFGSAGAARARLRYGWPTIATETVRAYERARAQLSSIRLEVG